MTQIASEDKYAKAKRLRDEHTIAILKSRAKKILVVAGPGTGKTHLFAKILEEKTRTLTLSFIKALVDDLSLKLCGLSEVKTLHSFARGIVKRATGKDVKVFPKLSAVIKEDANILLNREIDFDPIFHTRDDENQCIKFYRDRMRYYDNHYGHSDVIYGAVKFFESKKVDVPIYDQVIVDEFQDFNQLEVSLIDFLAEKNSILIAGDDDQALYEFKNASTEHIRQRHGNATFGFEQFNLPFCSRCTRVIVETSNDIVKAAKRAGLLQGRVEKTYEYFEDKLKDELSDRNSKIIHCHKWEAQIPYFIQSNLEQIAGHVRDKFSVLIISPWTKQLQRIGGALRDVGFKNISLPEGQTEREPTLLDGLKLLIENKKCKLGWRITAKALLDDVKFRSLLNETDQPAQKSFEDIMPQVHKREVRSLLAHLRKIIDGKPIDEDALREIFKRIRRDPFRESKDVLKDDVGSAKSIRISGVGNVPIKATTVQGSKGLDADIVFITHFDDRYLINDESKKITDLDVCKFLVALTRARHKVFLISTIKSDPTFLKWIDKSRIQKI